MLTVNSFAGRGFEILQELSKYDRDTKWAYAVGKMVPKWCHRFAWGSIATNPQFALKKFFLIICEVQWASLVAQW